MRHVVIDRQLEALQESVHRARARTKPKVDAVLAPSVGPVVYPIEWTSEKQRKAFFASNGFGRGIPTKRTAALNEGWLSVSTTIPGLGTNILIWNTKDYTQFVVGRFTPSTHMQRFHRNTGWQPVIRKIDVIKQILITGILKEFKWIVVK
jgi:hypothetical protein